MTSHIWAMWRSVSPYHSNGIGVGCCFFYKFTGQATLKRRYKYDKGQTTRKVMGGVFFVCMTFFPTLSGLQKNVINWNFPF